MDAPEELVEAVAAALYDSDWPTTGRHLANVRRARAVLAVPAIADALEAKRTLAKLQAIVDEPIHQHDPEPVYRVRYHRIAEMIGGQW